MAEDFPYDNGRKADDQIDGAQDTCQTADDCNDQHTNVHKTASLSILICLILFHTFIIMIQIRYQNRRRLFLAEL